MFVRTEVKKAGFLIKKHHVPRTGNMDKQKAVNLRLWQSEKPLQKALGNLPGAF